MRTWTIKVEGETVWVGTDQLSPGDESLKAFMDARYSGVIPLAYPAEKTYNHKDWMDRVRASLLFVTDLFGRPELTCSGFDVDELIIDEDAPDDAVF